jgi:ribonuclease BN (tRNA processing enzyme)
LGTRIVLDLGYATLPHLLALLKSHTADGIDAVVVTHAHPDHVVDLHGLFRARWFARREAAPIPLYAPAGVLVMVADLEAGDTAAVATVFDAYPLPALPYRVGPFLLESWALPHYVPNAGVRLTAPGLTVAYTGDTGPDASLADVGRDADVYIIDSTDRHQQSGTAPPPSDLRRNLTAREAAAAVTAAGARRLLLTHFWPGNDREASLTAAAEMFSGEILLADEGLEVTLP